MSAQRLDRRHQGLGLFIRHPDVGEHLLVQGHGGVLDRRAPELRDLHERGAPVSGVRDALHQTVGLQAPDGVRDAGDVYLEAVGGLRDRQRPGPAEGQQPQQFGQQGTPPQYGQQPQQPYGQAPQQYGQSPYAQYPSEQPQGAAAGGVPKMVNNAFWMIVAAGALWLISLLVAIPGLDDPTMRRTFDEQMRAGGADVDFESIKGVVVGMMVVVGLIGAGLVVMTLSLTDFAVPAILGGGSQDFIANAIYDQFFRTSDQGLGATLALLLVGVGSILVGIVFTLFGAGTLAMGRARK